MGLYYFHLCDGRTFTEGDDALEFPNPHAARKAAVESLRDCIAGDVKNGCLNLTGFIEVEDENHELVDVVLFEEAIHLNSENGCPPRRKY